MDIVVGETEGETNEERHIDAGEGLSDNVDEGTSDDADEERSDAADEGRSDNEDGGRSDNAAEGASRNADDRPSGDAAEGPSGDADKGPSGDADEGPSDDADEGPTVAAAEGLSCKADKGSCGDVAGCPSVDADKEGEVDDDDGRSVDDDESLCFDAVGLDADERLHVLRCALQAIDLEDAKELVTQLSNKITQLEKENGDLKGALVEELETNAANQETSDRQTQEFELKLKRKDTQLKEAIIHVDFIIKVLAEKEAAAEELKEKLLFTDGKVASMERLMSKRCESSWKDLENKLHKYEEQIRNLKLSVSVQMNTVETLSRGGYERMEELRDELRNMKQDLDDRDSIIVEVCRQRRVLEESAETSLEALRRSEKLLQELQRPLTESGMDTAEITGHLTEIREALNRNEKRTFELRSVEENKCAAFFEPTEERKRKRSYLFEEQFSLRNSSLELGEKFRKKKRKKHKTSSLTTIGHSP